MEKRTCGKAIVKRYWHKCADRWYWEDDRLRKEGKFVFKAWQKLSKRAVALMVCSHILRRRHSILGDSHRDYRLMSAENAKLLISAQREFDAMRLWTNEVLAFCEYLVKRIETMQQSSLESRKRKRSILGRHILVTTLRRARALWHCAIEFYLALSSGLAVYCGKNYEDTFPYIRVRKTHFMQICCGGKKVYFYVSWCG